MKKQFVQTIILLTIVLLTCCGKSEQQIKEEKEDFVKQKNEQLKITNKKALINLTQKYSAIMGWDTLDFYTYQYQEMFIDQRKPICFEGELNDITKTDSSYYLKLRNTSWHYKKNCIALISLSRQNFIEFNKILKSKNHTNEGCFVFKVSKIISASPEIKSDIEMEGEDSYSYLGFDFDETLLIFKGELIDFYLNETALKTDD